MTRSWFRRRTCSVANPIPIRVMRMVRFTKVFVAGVAFMAIPAASFCQDEKIRAWVDSLASEEFKERVEAQQQLAGWAEANPARSKDFLFEEFGKAKDPEARMRLRNTLMELVITEHQRTKGQGYLGITMGMLNPGLQGANGAAATGILVTAVAPACPAAEAGVQVGDVIVGLDKLRFDGIDAREAFIAEVKKFKPGSKIQLGIVRGAETLKIDVTLTARPMGLPDRQPPRFLNGLNPAAPDFELMDKLGKEAEEAFFKDWLLQKQAPPRKP